MTGCGCGCLSYFGFLIVTYGVVVLGAYLLWEFAHIRESYMRGDSVLAWAAIPAALVAFVMMVIGTIVGKVVSYRRFERAAVASQGGAGTPPPAG